MKFSIKYFFFKCDQMHRKLQILSHLLKKSLMENFISCVVIQSICWFLNNNFFNNFIEMQLALQMFQVKTATQSSKIEKSKTQTRTIDDFLFYMQDSFIPKLCMDIPAYTRRRFNVYTKSAMSIDVLYTLKWLRASTGIFNFFNIIIPSKL